VLDLCKVEEAWLRFTREFDQQIDTSLSDRALPFSNEPKSHKRRIWRRRHSDARAARSVNRRSGMLVT
jgi:hypothetical protein